MSKYSKALLLINYALYHVAINSYVNCYSISYISNYYVFHDRGTLFFADNFPTEYRITMEFLHNFF